MTSDFQIVRSRATEPLFYRVPAPEGMVPKEYQMAGVEYALAREHCLFGDAPGLGKTAECILTGNAIEAKRTLVVCPASLRLNWEREIWAWSTSERVTTYPVLKAKDGVSPDHEFVITSYALLANLDHLKALMDLRWDHLILDEAHALKDPKGNKRTLAICGGVSEGVEYEGIASVSGRITMASGTILPNQPIECYNAVRLMDWDAIDRMSLESFRDYYYDAGEGFVRKKVWDQKAQANVFKLVYSDNVRNVPRRLAELQRRLRSNVMVRRLKEQVLHELPPKQWHPFPIVINADIKRALKHPGWQQAETLYEMDKHAFDSGIPIDGAVSTARRELGDAKSPFIASYIEELIAEGVQKVVVAAWHRSVLDYLREKLAKHGLVYMDGRTTAANKQKAVDLFQEDDHVKIILGQMIPLGMGWTLTEATDVVLAEPDWVPGVNDQMLDRIHRMGQTGSYVIGHVPVVPDTLDERILSTAIEKDQNIYQALDAPI